MSRNELHNYLETNLIGCIVTKEENELLKNSGYESEMPDGWSFGDDVWARYQATGIEYFQVNWNKRKGTVVTE
ncbi:hypothetical protein D3P08_03815 [Paenibacillus nanensis]|uniref:Uncharacterized protein n=1 Tax=Paenibacillus nanensis TaxID=393251 RepID=A0A3A1VHW3_9BACL|nr:hypothetical protein D3P08_03815 [Paenibacillus nanensis]